MKETVGLNKSIFSLLFILFSFSISLYSQENKQEADSLVRLIEAKSAQLIQENNVSYRKVIGPAKFLHNNTYLLCDTAIWNVNANVIDAVGNVQVLQENTFLIGDKIEYVIDENLAKVRGNLVELFDKEGNILRTNFLDYNTKDSIGVFFGGGSMSNNDGNIIDSVDGEYDSKGKTFTFTNNVNMYTDSIFIKSNKLAYNTDLNKVLFYDNTIAWQEDNIFRTNNGEFDRNTNVFVFDKDAYVLTPQQELWSDTLKYYKDAGNAELFSNIQILDTTQKVIALADKADYNPTPMIVTLTKDPVICMYSNDNGVKDTLFARADIFKYYTKKYYEIDSATIATSKERLKLALTDPIKNPISNNSTLAPLSAQIDTISRDSVLIDSVLAPTIDTTTITFLDAYNNVKFFRTDVQGKCDSLVYTSLDSIARFYIDPIMWNDTKNQFTADSMQVVIKDNVLKKANLISNSFIITQEDSVYFNQIKSPEMSAFFDNNELSRFDAMGGVSAIFYLQEDSLVTEMNQKESKLLSATIKDRKIQRLKYMEQIKNDAYPVFGLPMDKQRLRGFIWRGDERPINKEEITTRTIKESKRDFVQSIELPDYSISNKYFPDKIGPIIEHKNQILEYKPNK